MDSGRDRKPGGTVRRSVVLGGGGIPGTAWMTGLAAELHCRGIDLNSADSIVGTSAGAIVGAALATGRDLESFADHQGPGADARPAPKPELLASVFSLLFDPSLDRNVVRRRVGQLAMAEDPAQSRHLEPMERLVGGSVWPDRLRVVVVEAESGERQVWSSGSGVPLATAISASHALPGAFPPVVVDGRYYIDGGVGSATNADIAADADVVVVIEPLAHMVSRDLLHSELAHASGTVVRFGPDAAMIDVFRTYAANPLASWPEAFREGVRQADSLARQLADAGWPTPKR
ncbi:patatin-like phospholipase family protein [Nocardia otitidiscaviarum]|uniref:patatin-like phospholipase family protein n=1 Tax=Nocardia otitidiscaviarum TaxID=1823 RepID=UPI0018953856|nr:patatin-like phospholipase family protein [Nocardia otitidiscaviarum]MBF6237646.1 patatin-like phospholipase family protein [Nocardia otitidiscaviarum]